MADRLGLIALLLAQWLFGWTCAPADGRVDCGPTLIVLASDCGGACQSDLPTDPEGEDGPACPMGCWECVVMAPPGVDLAPKPAIPELNTTLPAPEAPVIVELATRGPAAFAVPETGPPRQRCDRSCLCVWVI